MGNRFIPLFSGRVWAAPPTHSRGKLNPRELTRLILKHTGTASSRVIVGPRLGEDAAIIQDDGKLLVIHSDPVTGIAEEVGRLAVHVSVNDVVAKGADPKWVSLVLLLDAGVSAEGIQRIALQAHEACLEVGASIVGGHTEITPTVTRPVVVATVVGEAMEGHFFTSAGAKPGNRIIMTKTAALEGSAILARSDPSLRKTLGRKLIESASSFLDQISVYPEARVARGHPGVTAMHDVTEGGVLCAVQEITSASGYGFIVDAERVPVTEETRQICSALRLDPLRMIGSGSLIIAIYREHTRDLLERLHDKGILASDIGRVTKSGAWLLRDGKRFKVERFVEEEIWKVLR